MDGHLRAESLLIAPSDGVKRFKRQFLEFGTDTKPASLTGQLRASTNMDDYRVYQDLTTFTPLSCGCKLGGDDTPFTDHRFSHADRHGTLAGVFTDAKHDRS